MVKTSSVNTQSLFVVVTGLGNSGKTQQILYLLRAEVDGQPVATPTLYLIAEASGEGTAGEVLLDPSRCCVWPVACCEDAVLAVEACFPHSGALTLGAAKAKWHRHVCGLADAGGAPRPPAPAASARDGEVLRSVVVDTMSTLYKGSDDRHGELLKAESEKKRPGSSRDRAGKKDAPWNDLRITGGGAAKQCKHLVNVLNGATQHHRGLICLVTVHTTGAVQLVAGGEGEPTQAIVCGEVPDLGSAKPTAAGINVPGYSATWNTLAAKANIVVHCIADVPDYSRLSMSEINDPTKAPAVKFGLITAKGSYPGRGPVMWVKSQGGEGPFGYFSCMPRVWHPDVPCDDVINTEVSSDPITDKNGVVIGHTPKPSVGAMIAYALKLYRADQSGGA